MTAGMYAAAHDGPGGEDIAGAVARHVDGVTVLHTRCVRVPIDGAEVYVGRLAQFDIIVRRHAREWTIGQLDSRPCFVDGHYVARPYLYGAGPTIESAELAVMEDAERRRDAGAEPAEAIEWARGVASRGGAL